MTRLILTTNDSERGRLSVAARLADMRDSRSAFGSSGDRCRREAELDDIAGVARATSQRAGFPLARLCRRQRLEEVQRKGLGLIDFCERFETIELWVDPDPNAN